MQIGNKTYNGTVGSNFSTLNIGGTLISTGRYPIESWRVWDTVEEAKSFVMYEGADATAFVGMILSIKSGLGKGVYVLNKVGNAAKTNGKFDETAWTKLLDNSANGQYLKDVEYIDPSSPDYVDSDSDANDVGILKFTFIKDDGTEEIIRYDLNAILSEATINAIIRSCSVNETYTATVSVGNIAAGTTIAKGKSIEELLKEILCKEVWATDKTLPTAAITFKGFVNDSNTFAQISGTYEIGTKIDNVTYDTVSFTDGRIGSYTGTTKTTISAGCLTDGNPVLTDKVTQPYYVVNGSQTLAKAHQDYEASSADTVSNLGHTATGNYASHKIQVPAGSTAAVSCTITGKYKAWVAGLSYGSLTNQSTPQQILTAFGQSGLKFIDANGQETFGSSGTISVDGSHQVYGFFPTTHKMTGTQMNSAVNPVIISSDIDYTLPNGTTIKYTLATWPSVSQTYNAVKVQKK